MLIEVTEMNGIDQINNLDQRLAIQKEKRIRDASLKLAEQSTRESQRQKNCKSRFRGPFKRGWIAKY